MLKVHHNMAERKNFLLLAIGLGIAGVVIGTVTVWNMIFDLLN